VAVSARFWRLLFTSGNGNDIWLAEVEFLDAAASLVSPAGAAVISGGDWGAGYEKENAFDGVKSASNNGWASKPAFPAWIGLAFPSPVAVSTAKIYLSPIASAWDELPVPGHVHLQHSDDGWRWGNTFQRFNGDYVVGGILLSQPGGPLTMSNNHALLAASAALGSTHVMGSRALLARDMEFGGAGRVWGTNQIELTGGALVPAGGRVVLLRQRDKLVVRETWADPITGAWEFRGLDTRQDFLALAEDLAGNYRPVAASRLTPEVP
jgi:hypothetical protein